MATLYGSIRETSRYPSTGRLSAPPVQGVVCLWPASMLWLALEHLNLHLGPFGGQRKNLRLGFNRFAGCFSQKKDT